MPIRNPDLTQNVEPSSDGMFFFFFSLSLELVSLAHHTLQSDTHTKIRWGEGGTPGGSNAFFLKFFRAQERTQTHGSE